ncbi:MAG: hypothetical protein HY820_10475 [Acidobacteria bacterium]|nr:hypothetical protein [Acidobacteriota bacterium]
MTSTTFHSPPRTRDVLLAQIRAVGVAPQGPALAAMAVVALATLFITIESLKTGKGIAFHPERQMLPGIMGLLLPIMVWRGEERFGASFLWTLPVDRWRHALAKVFAGWVWLMGGVALFVFWSLALTLLSGGTILAEETLRLLRSVSLASRTLDPAAVETVRWTPEPLLWLAPLTSATATYLLASALGLGTRHPLRWIVGSVIGFYVVSGVGEAANGVWLGFEPLLESVFEGPYGLDALLTARTTFLNIEATLTTGDRVEVWRALPDAGQWATATLLWMGAGLVTLLAAAFRHREGRRA